MKSLYFLLFSLITCAAIGQPVINVIGPSVGDNFTLDSDENIYDPGEEGPNQTYDFSSFTGTESFQYSIVDPASTEFGSIFSQSNAAWFFSVEEFGSFYAYFDYSENIWREYGSASEFGGFSSTILYDDPLDRISGPINYGDSGSDDYSGELSSVGFEAPLSGSTSYNVDGYGTLITPAGSFENCLRVNSTTEEEQDLGKGGTATTVFTEYIYFLEGYPVPIVYYSIVESFFNGDPEETSYQITVVSDYNGSPLNTLEMEDAVFRLFPNPANDILQVQLEEMNSSISIFDINGKVVLNGIYSQNQDINISELKPGVYIVQAQGISGNVYRKKLVVN